MLHAPLGTILRRSQGSALHWPKHRASDVLEIGCAATSDIMQNGLGDKAAAVSFSGHAVQNSQCFIWKDDIDAFAHTILGFKNLAYTHSVCMFNGFPAGSGRAECRRFLDTQSIQFQSVSIAFNQRPATVSITIRSKPCLYGVSAIPIALTFGVCEGRANLQSRRSSGRDFPTYPLGNCIDESFVVD